jgi:hypothetical protein
MTRNPIPKFAADYPERATELNHLHLTFYCINCQRKRETTYITPNFGPFCDECMNDLQTVMVAKA